MKYAPTRDPTGTQYKDEHRGEDEKRTRVRREDNTRMKTRIKTG
jgi:hypothetical protein